MSDFVVDILQLRENPYQNGVRLGKYIKVKPILQTFKRMTKPEIDCTNMKSIYRQLAPHLIEELQGVADGLGIPYPKAYAMFSGYDVPKTDAMGCTAMATNDFYVRNYDFTPEIYDSVFTLNQSSSTLATAGYNLQLIGRHDGVNEHGLVAGLHFVSQEDYQEGISAWLSLRMLLDSCSTVDEAVTMLKEIPHAACYNFSLADAGGYKVVVEASPKVVKVREDREFLSCVNHFQMLEMQQYNRENIDRSMKRNALLKEYQDNLLDQDEWFNLFRDKDSPLFFQEYNNLFGTLHTFSYSYEDTRILTTIAQSETILDFHFHDWVKGQNINQDRMVGTIENSQN
jgi:predicted choloylglycine hydrolase